MKRVAVNSHRSRSIDEETQMKLRHQIDLQDYLELEKEVVSKEKRLQTVKQNRDTLLAEISFLRRRHGYLLKTQSAEMEREIVKHPKSDLQLKVYGSKRKFNVNEAVQNNSAPVLDTKTNWKSLEDEQEMRRETCQKPVRLPKKPKNFLMNGKKVGKKKISVPDQVVLKV
ncbi:hypothetical protein UlMin_034451 [Ulmus minor]